MSESKISYGGRSLDAPAGLTLDEIKSLMSRHFPELADPEVKADKKDGVTTYTFSKKAGRKGATNTVAIDRLLSAKRRKPRTTAGTAALAAKCLNGNWRVRRKLDKAFDGYFTDARTKERDQLGTLCSALSQLPAIPVDQVTLL